MNPRGLILGSAAALGALYVMRMQEAQADVYTGGEASAGSGFSFGELLPSFVTDFTDSASAQVLDLLQLGPGAAELGAMMGDTNIQAFLRVIRVGEGTDGPLGYRTMFGGGTFDSFADHPRQLNVATFSNGKTVKSTAAGAYQFLSRTWDECQRALGLPDFSPQSQDLAALFLIRRRGALDDVRAGRFAAAVRKCSREWASLPGSPYGQPTLTMDRAAAIYADAGGAAIA